MVGDVGKGSRPDADGDREEPNQGAGERKCLRDDGEAQRPWLRRPAKGERRDEDDRDHRLRDRSLPVAITVKQHARMDGRRGGERNRFEEKEQSRRAGCR